MQKLNVTLALAAGMLGGFLSRSITLPSVLAQNPAPQPAPTVTKEIRAQSFTLVDGANRIVGTFTSEPGTTGWPVPQPRIILRDSRGHEIWSADGGSTTVRPVPISER